MESNSGSAKDNFDIYLPNCFSRHNKAIYFVFFAIIIVLIVFQLIKTM
jgi:hypothetical protein